MEIVVIILIIVALLVALVGGYFLATHQHQLATATASAITRATTIPAGDVAALNAKVSGVGDQVAAIAAKVGVETNTAISDATKSAG